jgi:ankyrin repeat protein
VALTAPAAVTENDRALLHAVHQGQLARVAALLKAGADVNARHPPWQLTPLLVASAVNIATVELLLQHGAAVNVHDRDGQTPLMKAVATREAPIIARLLKAGAEIDARDHHGHTALTLAVMHSDPQILALLLRRGARTDVVTLTGTTPWSMAQALRAAALAMRESPHDHAVASAAPASHRMRTKAEALAQTQAVLGALDAVGATQPQQPVPHFDVLHSRHRPDSSTRQ